MFPSLKGFVFQWLWTLCSIHDYFIPRFDFASIFCIPFNGDLWVGFGKPALPLVWVKKFEREEKLTGQESPSPKVWIRHCLSQVSSVSNYIVISELLNWLTSKGVCGSCAILYCLVKVLPFHQPLTASIKGKPGVTRSLSRSQTWRPMAKWL